MIGRRCAKVRNVNNRAIFRLHPIVLLQRTAAGVIRPGGGTYHTLPTT